MANLDSCYFCGEADDVDRYAVVPGRLNPSEDEQRAVALCPPCFEKLRTVIEPLISRIDASGAAQPSRSTDVRRDGAERSTTDAGSGSDADDRLEPGTQPDSDGMPSASDLTAEREAAREAMRMSQGKPTGYQKVMRLLENRSFPVRRSTISELAKDAYGIAPEQADEIIATAIEDGHLTEDREDPDVLYRGNQ